VAALRQLRLLKGSTREFLASDSGLSDVTDRSHHWIGALAPKSFMARNVSVDSA
jgi:hypothetical protein